MSSFLRVPIGCCLDNGKINSRAGVGGWFGDNNKNNFAIRLNNSWLTPGPQTNQKAEIFAGNLYF